MTYDQWKTTNPADEYLGPVPDYGSQVEVISGGPDFLNAFLDEVLVAFAVRSRDTWVFYEIDDDDKEYLRGFANSKVEACARLIDLAEEIADGRTA
jgi:hypothetical protein